MSNATIIFGTKRLGKVATVTSEKYPNLAVVTVEGLKGAKKSRRILFNKTAANLLNLETGSVQHLVFASVETGEESGREVLIADAASMEGNGDMVTYKTSKNTVSFESTKESGKAVTSSHMCGEIFAFLDKDDSASVEFSLQAFDNDQLDAFSLRGMEVESDTMVGSVTSNVVGEENVIETNNGFMSGSEVRESIQDEVAAAETANPIMEQEVVEPEVVSSGMPQRQTAY